MVSVARFLSTLFVAIGLAITGSVSSFGAGPTLGCPTEIDASGNVTAIDIRVGASPSLQLENNKGMFLLRPVSKEKRKLLRLEVAKDEKGVVLNVVNNTDATVTFDIQSLEESGWVGGSTVEVKHGEKSQQHFAASTLRVRLSNFKVRPPEEPKK
jgi:hypothetical protein